MLDYLLKLKNKKGFTLVELIVIIAIIGILSSILIPILGGYIEEQKRKDAVVKADQLRNYLNNYLIEQELAGKGMYYNDRYAVLAYGLFDDGNGMVNGGEILDDPVKYVGCHVEKEEMSADPAPIKGGYPGGVAGKNWKSGNPDIEETNLRDEMKRIIPEMELEDEHFLIIAFAKNNIIEQLIYFPGMIGYFDFGVVQDIVREFFNLGTDKSSQGGKIFEISLNPEGEPSINDGELTMDLLKNGGRADIVTGTFVAASPAL